MGNPDIETVLRTLWQAAVDAATSGDFRGENGELNEDAYLRYQRAAIAQAREQISS